MKPLILLITVFLLSLLILKVFRGSYHFSLSGRIALSAMLLFTALGHFMFSKGMAMMIPEFIPFKIHVVYFTGIVEVIAAFTLLLPDWQRMTGLFLMVFFILILPANVYAAMKQVNYQSGTYDGSGLPYLWFRIPLQLFYILWTYYFAVKR